MSPAVRLTRVHAAGLSLLLICVFWAMTFGLVRESLTTYACAPFAFLFWRFLLASLFGVLYFFPGLRRATWTGAWAGMVCGGFLFVGFAGQTVGLLSTPAPRSAFLTGLFVIVVPYLAWLTLRRPLQMHIVLAACLATYGLYLITHPGQAEFTRGDLYTLLGAVGFAGHIVALEEANRLADYRQLVVVQFFTVLVLCGLFMVFRGETALPGHAYVSLSIVFTALFATVLAVAVQTWAQRLVPASETALIFATEPVFTLLISAIFFHEFFTRLQATGATLILVGVLVVSLVGIPAAPGAVPEGEAAAPPGDVPRLE